MYTISAPILDPMIKDVATTRTLVSRSQTQPSAMQREGSGQPTVLAFIKSVKYLANW